MDVISNEMKQKMQAAIKSKLHDLECFVDDELSYYVTVMVVNKRTRTQMETDLQLFLGAKTELFVDWVHQVLTKQQEDTVAAPSIKTAECNTSKDISSSKDKKKKKINDKHKKKHIKDEEKNLKKKIHKMKMSNRHEKSRPNVPLLLVNIPKSNKNSNDLRENPIKNLENIEVKTQLLKQKLTSKWDSLSNDDFLNVRTEAEELMKFLDEDVIEEITQQEPVVKTTPTDVFKSTTSTPIMPKSIIIKPKKTVRERLEPRQWSKKHTQEKKMERISKLKIRSNRTSNTTVGYVKPWPRDSIKSSSLELRASAAVPKNLSNTSCLKEDRTADVDGTKMQKPDIQAHIEHSPETISFDRDENKNGQKIHNLSNNKEKNRDYLNALLAKKLQEEDLRISTAETSDQNKEKSKTYTRRESIDKNDDVPPTKKTKVSPVELTIAIEETEKDKMQKLTYTQKVNTNSNLSSSERKPVWCRMFPTCHYGSACVFTHPQCKYLAACTRRNCVYSHSLSSPLASTYLTHSTSPVAPSFASHMVSAVCKFFLNCRNPVCQYKHPKVCRYDRDCSKQVCKFYHTKTKMALSRLVKNFSI